MLAEDSKERRKAVADEILKQTSVDDHFKKAAPEDKPTPYTDELFKEAAIEWLIETNQVCYLYLVPAICETDQLPQAYSGI